MSTDNTPEGLREAERKALAVAFARSTRNPDHLAFLAAPTVERILADRHAALLAEVAASRETLGRVEVVIDSMRDPDSWSSLTEDSFPWIVRDLRAALGRDA